MSCRTVLRRSSVPLWPAGAGRPVCRAHSGARWGKASGAVNAVHPWRSAPRRRWSAFGAPACYDTRTNVQFGEGGAGAFSDGKLNTGTKDARARFVPPVVCGGGSPPGNILWDAKPHIGTDLASWGRESHPEEIRSLGGEVRFYAAVSDLRVQDGRLSAVVLENGGNDRLFSSHFGGGPQRARDTFRMLEKRGVRLEPKPFFARSAH